MYPSVIPGFVEQQANLVLPLQISAMAKYSHRQGFDFSWEVLPGFFRAAVAGSFWPVAGRVPG